MTHLSTSGLMTVVRSPPNAHTEHSEAHQRAAMSFLQKALRSVNSAVLSSKQCAYRSSPVPSYAAAVL